MEVLEGIDLTEGVAEWFQRLDYEFMILHIVVCYGLYYSENMRWIVEYFSPVRRKGTSKAIWVIGAFLALVEMCRFIPYTGGEGGLNYQKFVAIFHSYIFIQVFVDPIVTNANRWLNLAGSRKPKKELDR